MLELSHFYYLMDSQPYVFLSVMPSYNKANGSLVKG